jgi:hypothetical protein
MATQPTAITEFCLDDQDLNGDDLKIPPLSDVIQTGLLPNMPMARVWLNHYLNQHAAMGLFVQDELLSIGRVLQYINGTEPDFATDFEGTWSLLGTQTIGGQTVNHYRRTA